jgi:hypothetical protein
MESIDNILQLISVILTTIGIIVAIGGMTDVGLLLSGLSSTQTCVSKFAPDLLTHLCA